MRRWAPLLAILTGVAISASHAVGASRSSHVSTPAWDKVAAANYLDSRQIWWMQWPKAQRDHDTACVSCHTAVPYALSRPALRGSLGEHSLSKPEQQMIAYITKRVGLWDAIKPFYSDEEVGPKKTVESRGTEAILNALILARYDEPSGRMSIATRKAFDHMWDTQLSGGDERGSWHWLNFQNAPWESDISQYYGTALAGVAVGFAPATYRNSHIGTGLNQLRSYLASHYESQPLINRVVVLWAASRLPDLLSEVRRKQLLAAISEAQRPDGGWSLSSMGNWKRNDDTALDERSDGYATGLVVYALKVSGSSIDSPSMRRGIAWLLANQDVKQGLWPAYSLNKERDPASDIGRFMSDAATSYSVLALEATGR